MYVIAKALPDGKADAVSRFIVENIICTFGSPRSILSDQGKVFMSNLVTGILKHLGVKPLVTTPYHPQTNGLTERFNKCLADMLSMYCSTAQNDWDESLPHLIFAHNSSRQDSTGFSPYFLLHGREPRYPTEDMLYETAEEESVQQVLDRFDQARKVAKARIEASQKRSALRYNQSHRILEFKPGDLVVVYYPTRYVGKADKLLHKFRGPCKVIARTSDVNYKVEVNKRGKGAKFETVHVSRLKPYHIRIYEP